jgi:hypothetical protein
MPNPRTGVAAATAALILTALAPAGAEAAQRLYGVTAGGRLVTFNSDSPGAVRASKRISGLRKGEAIAAIDVRPSNSGLYAVTDAGRLYTVAAPTGRATAVSANPFGLSLQGRRVGLDFNPTVDKLRVVSDENQNFRVDPITGQVLDGDPAQPGVQPDRDLSYEPADPAAGSDPQVGSVAYTDNTPGATTTRLFGIDVARGTLVLQDPPNQGLLSTVGSVGTRARRAVGFDIARDGTAFLASRAAGRSVRLYRVDLGTGRATRSARRHTVGTYRGRRGDPIRALAAGGSVSDDDRNPRVGNRKLNDPRVRQLLRGRVLRLEVRCSEACSVQTQLVLGRRVVGGASGKVRSRAGRVVLRLRLNRKGRGIVRRLRPDRLDVGIRVADAAGNTVRTRRYQSR